MSQLHQHSGQSPNRNTLQLKIVVLEDDPRTRYQLRSLLSRNGYRCMSAGSIHSAADLLFQHQVDLIILDRVLPDGDGLDLLQNKDYDHARVLVLSSKDEVADRVKGLSIGADDYLAKPFSEEELMLRISALLRRSKISIARQIEMGSYVLELDTGELRKKSDNQCCCVLTGKEVKAIEILGSANSNAVAKSEFIARLWSSEKYPTQGAVDVFMSRLRKKLHHSAPEILIESRYGIGYRLVCEKIN